MKFSRAIYRVFLFIFLTIFCIHIAFYTHAYFSKPLKLNSTGTYYLYDKDENLIYHGSSINEWVNLDEISPYLVNAVISVEDKTFYEHNGFDYARIIAAIFKNIKNGRIVEGASTISQQYIKNAYLSFDKTLKRKIKEAILTLNLEVHYTKDEILEAYLNTINYGEGNYGIEKASKYYFNKSAKDLTLEEALILAGIPKSPNNYNPVASYEKALKRAKVVALSMYNNGYISYDEYQNLYKDTLFIYGKKDNTNLKTLMYYQDAVIDEIKNKTNISPEEINSGSLKVYTTLDLNAQTIMENEINNNLNIKDIQVANVIINPMTGAIVALTGGKDYSLSQYNRAINSKRQVGSTMKVFLYYAALASGMRSSSTFKSQYTLFNLDENVIYSPKNWANNYANKDITMAAAIAYSDNIYAVKTNLFLGTDKLPYYAHLAGISGNLSNVASLALGTNEINLLDYANGFTTLASGGYQRNLHMIDHIEDKNGNIIYKYKESNNLVLNPNYVFILNELLTSTTNSAFIDYSTPTAMAISSKLKNKYAIKSGTTDTDYLTIGYNKNYLMLMWAGYDDNKSIPNTLGNISKNIWANIMNQIDINRENYWYQMPENVVGVPLDAVTGLPTSNTKKINMFYFIKGSEPNYTISDYKKKED